MKTYVDLW